MALLRLNLNFLGGLIAGIALMWFQQAWWMMTKIHLESATENHVQSPSLKDGAMTATATTNTADGWKTINVFYGDIEKSEFYTDKAWVSQAHQDEAVMALIGEKGYFIDLASNHAVEFSNTYSLEKHGWNGLCIEPNPAYWYGLSHRKCQVVGSMVGAQKEQVQVKFRGVFGGIVGKMDEKLANFKKEPNAPIETRFTAPFVEVLEKYNVPPRIDYLSLDVEGAEHLIMKDFPWDHYTISVITAERPSDDLKKLFTAQGYVFLKDLTWWGETLWAHKSTGFTPKDPKVMSIPYDGRN